MTWPEALRNALLMPGGARFYRCALQVNPYEYLIRHTKKTSFTTESDYNEAIIRACTDNGIEVIAVTDHYRVKTSVALWEAARAAGLYVLPGFEAVTKEGIHLLCLFDPDKSVDALERVLGACGIHGNDLDSPIGQHDVMEFLEESQKWGAACIAAHVPSEGGLLATLKGQARINAWRSPFLNACSLPGPVSGAPDNVRKILENKDATHRRDRPVAVLNAQDVNGPQDILKPGTSCWIKASEISVEGLRQAFLDPESRIRLASDSLPEEHAEFVAMAWEGGFLDGATLRFNENLNVLIGGRGAGKSTVVESVRHVLNLEPLGDDARKSHEGIVRHVLRGGTKISLLVRSHHPAVREYLIERAIPNPPVVRDESGSVLDLAPSDVIPQAEVYGQHEISELARSPEKLTLLLERFVQREPELDRRKRDVDRDLNRSRSQVLEIRKELKDIEESLAALPALEEKLRRFEEAGLEDKLKDQSLLVSEERVLKTADDRVTPFRDLLEELRRELPIDRDFLSADELKELPRKEVLARADPIIERLNQDLEDVADRFDQALERAEQGLGSARTNWESLKEGVQADYERILRELQKTKVDGTEFIQLRSQIEELQPLKEKESALQGDLRDQENHRRTLLASWEDLKSEEFRHLDRAVGKVNRQLAGRVRVQVTFGGNREPLFQLLRERVGGRLSEAIDALKVRAELSVKEFAEACRAGRGKLEQEFRIPSAQAERIAEALAEVAMQIEELDLPPTTRIELNVAGDGQTPAWQALEDLSTGQKATAILLLLLLESDAPLVVDQPEDDLDNRFITEGIVPKMREEKRRRQFVFATHNANIPVLGDAELIVGLSASGEAEQGRAGIPADHVGSIDSRFVRELVGEVLEGGKEAFEMRRLKYGY